MQAKPRVTLPLYGLLILIAIVIGWSGYLGIGWYQGYKLGCLIAAEATSPEAKGQAAWDEQRLRRVNVEERLQHLAPWQRRVTFATAVDSWRDYAPRSSYGSMFLWNLLVRNAEHDFVRKMVEAPILDMDMSISGAESQRMSTTIDQLRRVSALPIYLAGPDRSMNDSDVVPIGGPFADSLDTLAAASGYRWQVVDQVIAIGTDTEVSELVRRAERRDRRIARCQNRMATRPVSFSEILTEPITLEFLEWPLSDVVDFLGDYLNVNFKIRTDRAIESGSSRVVDQPVTVHVDTITSGQALDCLLLPTGLDWDVFEELIVIGTPGELAGFAARLSRMHQRIALARNSTNSAQQRIADKLVEPATLEFVQTPLRDVVDFFEDWAGFDVLVLDAPAELGRMNSAIREKAITSHVASVTLGMSLECLAHENGLEWDAIDGFLCVGDASGIDHFRDRVARTDVMLQSSATELAAFLGTTLRDLKELPDGAIVLARHIEPGTYSPAELAEHFQPTVDASGPWVRRISNLDETVCRALDVVCEITRLNWELLSDGSIHVFE